MTRGVSGQEDHLDVLIVGAGISGVDAAYHLQTRCPDKSYAILEARGRIGGTWDLFRYPGVRSDSDIYTLGFPFRPWRGDKSIVGGAEIRAYVEETAREFGIDRRIRFGHRVTRAAWCSREARWRVEAETEEGPRRFSCVFVFLASGYYDYGRGYRPQWQGEADFKGRIVHPQFWPEALDYRGKHVVVIGSGATAVTLVPALAEQAAHVTMLQRSPSYIASRPSRDALARPLGPALTRLKNVLLGIWFFSLARRRPAKVRAKLLDLVRGELPRGYDVERHFGPRYNPWDQRLCLVPDGDLFAQIRDGRVAIATGEIETFTPGGIRLTSGEEIAADIVVAATGLVVKLLGGIALEVDGEPAKPAERLVYKGMMLSDVPNHALAFGYTNASWTLKCDLTARYVCRLLRHMDRQGWDVCVPRLPANGVERQPMLDFSSGYVARAEPFLPKQGAQAPWRVHQNYLKDLGALRFGGIVDGTMEFRRSSPPPA
ncbi:MAG: NAD(P)/FAD-dependent oxidoreductase [Pseudomonadota bacterium]|nr:NAD(P)/FAD-dependent oxidoreductase [Pseudomonadota bacterium]